MVLAVLLNKSLISTFRAVAILRSVSMVGLPLTIRDKATFVIPNIAARSFSVIPFSLSTSFNRKMLFIAFALLICGGYI
nr:MAG TPA: hypothetical protein [Caudoviricetes sp.]